MERVQAPIIFSDDIRAFAEEMGRWVIAEMEHWGVGAWSFAWDHAYRRLGSCCGAHKKITISKYLLVEAKYGNEEIFKMVVRHEIAHAKAYNVDHYWGGHGEPWKKWCRIIGIEPKAQVQFERFVSKRYFLKKGKGEEDFPSENRGRYALIVKSTGEVIRYYVRKPQFKKSLRWRYIKGRPETVGQLTVVEVSTDVTLN